MAILIPDQPKECTYGERLVYEKLGRDLEKDWIILHSLGLHGHKTKIWGEADIVILSTRGIFALEVKGGKVSCKDGVWHFGSPGQEYTKKEDPWTQSKGTMWAISKKLEEADSIFKDLLFGFGVVMPNETFISTGAEIEQAVLLDKRDFKKNFGFYIGRIQRHWSNVYHVKHGRDPRFPTRDEILLARKILRPDIDSAFSTGSYLTSVQSELKQLSIEQVRASRRMAANPRTVVRGRAGTGKTIIAVERAKQLSAEGKKVLYLCFNQLLARHLKLAIADDPRSKGIDIHHVHELYANVIKRANMQDRLDIAQDDPEYYEVIYPRVFIEAAMEIDLPAWDALVIVEAQDLLTPDNLDAFDLLLGIPGINRGQWHIFMDRLQNIYGSDIQESVDKRLSEAQPAFDDLYENCRNTREVAVQASIISGIDLAIEGAPLGAPCDNIYYQDQSSFESQLVQAVTKLLNDGVQPEDIAILSTRKRENSLVADIDSIAGIPLVNVNDSFQGDMVFSTMHAFKGLERAVILAIDMEDMGHPDVRMLHYAGLSRAVGLLHTFLPDKAKTIYSGQAAEFAKRLSESAD